MNTCSAFLARSTTALLLAGAAFAARTSDPLEAFTQRMAASTLAANVFMDVATDRILETSRAQNAISAEVDAARQAVSARFQEPWSYETSVWWTWRVAGSGSAFAPVIHSTTNASRSLSDLYLLAHPYDASYLGSLPEDVQQYLGLVAPQHLSAFVFSARIDADLDTVGLAASYQYQGAELLFFCPLTIFAPGSSVTPLQSAAGLWLSTMECLVGDIGLYPAFVDSVAGAPDTSMDGPLGLSAISSEFPCSSGDVLQCLTDAWNAFLARKAFLTNALKQNLANELRLHNRNVADQNAIFLTAMRQAGGAVAGLLHLLGIPGAIGPNAGLIEEIARGHNIRIAQLRDAHAARVQMLREQYCADLTAAVNQAFAQLQACMRDVCPGSEAIIQAKLEQLRAQLMGMGASCQ